MSSIRKEIEVSLAHPRNFDSPDITELVRQVRKEIEDEVTRVNLRLGTDQGEEDHWKPATPDDLGGGPVDMGGGI